MDSKMTLGTHTVAISWPAITTHIRSQKKHGPEKHHALAQHPAYSRTAYTVLARVCLVQRWGNAPRATVMQCKLGLCTHQLAPWMLLCSASSSLAWRGPGRGPAMLAARKFAHLASTSQAAPLDHQPVAVAHARGSPWIILFHWPLSRN